MRIAILVSVIAVVVGGFVSAQSRPDFSGEWVLRASPIPNVTDRINVRQTPDLLVVDTLTASGPARFEYRLDGTESLNRLPDPDVTVDNRVVARAAWSGASLQITEWRTAGGPPTLKVWRLDGDDLVLTAQIYTGPELTVVYTRR